MNTGWTKVADRHPLPHARYEVRREDVGRFIATPCYGLHEPWWVPLIASVFAPEITIPFSETDEWRTENPGPTKVEGAALPVESHDECHGLDTREQVFFYEQEFYVLSNFSAFSIMWEKSPREGLVRFDTSEALYHWMKFRPDVPSSDQRRIAEMIRTASSAHEAFKIAERYHVLRRPDWDEVKVDVMRGILRAKARQHEYVRRKLLETGDRELVENSWRDDFWGWGPNRDGKNMLGKLWMGIREELRAKPRDDSDHRFDAMMEHGLSIFGPTGQLHAPADGDIHDGGEL